MSIAQGGGYGASNHNCRLKQAKVAAAEYTILLGSRLMIYIWHQRLSKAVHPSIHVELTSASRILTNEEKIPLLGTTSFLRSFCAAAVVENSLL